MQGGNLKMKLFQKGLSAFLVMTTVVSMPGLGMREGSNVWAADKSLEEYKEILNYTAEYEDYHTYLQDTGTTNRPTDIYQIEAANYVNSEGMTPKVLNNYEGMDGDSVYTEEAGLIEYQVDVKEAGLYQVSLEYYPVEGNGSSIQRSIFVDGELPYKELSLVEFSRVWVNELEETQSDNQGNDLKPTQVEAPEWMVSKCQDTDGYVREPLSIYLTAGEHSITLVSRREPMVLKSIILSNDGDTADYATTLADWEAQGAKDTSSQNIEIQAEDATKKSSSMLYPVQDQSSPAITPYSASELKNNTIGGNNWRLTGQWIEWEFDAPQTGYYNITLHAKQNFLKGIYVSRKITIDGEVPFEEMSHYGFAYQSGWNMDTLSDSDGNAYKFYLEEGKHTIRMQVVLGDFAEIISQVQTIVTELNKEYRKIIRITGVAPDSYRDYQIEKSLPELGDELSAIETELSTVMTQLESLGCSGSEETVLITMRDQLAEITKDPEKVTKMVKDFKTNVSALGTWITNAQSQPLQLDSLYITSPETSIADKNNSFFDNFVHESKKLYYSFLIDYNSIGNVAEDTKDSKTITVWIGTGRDQANVIKSLVDETFTPDTGINVNVQLVDMNTLLQATLAGQGPDVALQVANNNGVVVSSATGTTAFSNDLPVNYGLRDAVVDLTEFADCKEVESRFRDSALEPFTYDNALYALPETQTFQMMFYRKDILNELGIEVPKTWDDMKVVLSELSKNQMTLGMLPTELTFDSLLYQNGGNLYTDDDTESALDSDEAISAFKDYCEFYTDYKLDRETSVEQRFRTGESPIIIADYTTYNNLSVSAPDIKGLWGFSALPGVEQADGTINNTSASTGLACMMMSNTKDKEASWEFMKWWLSADVQTSYGKEMEGLMGEAARYPTANIEAFGNLPWPTDDYEALNEQFENVEGIEQVPGSYYTWRNVNNAFYSVVVAAEDKRLQPREALTEYIEYIDAEITGKRQEFGMTTAK